MLISPKEKLSSLSEKLSAMTGLGAAGLAAGLQHKMNKENKQNK
jgi:hypothetical protein